jgi:hypothetical protein
MIGVFEVVLWVEEGEGEVKMGSEAEVYAALGSITDCEGLVTESVVSWLSDVRVSDPDNEDMAGAGVSTIGGDDESIGETEGVITNPCDVPTGITTPLDGSFALLWGAWLEGSEGGGEVEVDVVVDCGSEGFVTPAETSGFFEDREKNDM